jgi:hypothetical protein
MDKGSKGEIVEIEGESFPVEDETTALLRGGITLDLLQKLNASLGNIRESHLKLTERLEEVETIRLKQEGAVELVQMILKAQGKLE